MSGTAPHDAPEDPLPGREPTAEERSMGRPWDDSYRDGPAPWDIGRPQPAVVRLADAGAFTGPVLDAGCGVGDNALLLAERGLAVLGVDVAPTALALARDKAAARRLDAEFAPADGLRLDALGRRFATVLDCALFHTFHADEWPRYAGSLAAVTEPGGTVHVICFSDEGDDQGPHPVNRDELAGAFAGDRWDVVEIVPERLETRFHEHGAPAWRAAVRRR